jgi:uncharacterized membrane protein
VASPLRFNEYLASKVVTLTGLSVAIAVFVVVATHGLNVGFVPLLLGTALGTVLMLLLGFLTAMPFKSVSDWFMPAVFPIALFNLPIFHYSGVWETPWLTEMLADNYQVDLKPYYPLILTGFLLLSSAIVIGAELAGLRCRICR